MTPSRHVHNGPRKRPSQSSEDFLAENTRRGDASDGCWSWQGKPDINGYGRIPVDGRRWLVHRYAYVLSHGPIPDGHDVDHACHNNSGCAGGRCQHRLCVNPAHLEAVPPLVNRHRSHLHNINKTRCPDGHPYTAENTIIQRKPDGRTARACRECARIADRQPDRVARQRERRRSRAVAS